MSIRRALLISAVLLTGVASAGYAQQSTELYIPLGKSPGVSEQYTTLGTIESVNQREGTITVLQSGQHYTIRFTPETKVYLDHSAMKQPNRPGTIADCKPNRTVEVKYRDNKRGEVAEWIKVQMPEGQ